jgi:acyl-CoA oxidase
MPILAETYALVFTARAIRRMYEKVLQDLNNFDLSSIAEFHALAAGVKASATWFTATAADICRQCMGGHGYSAYSKMPGIFNDWVVLLAGEGDNMVLVQQTARYLIRAAKKVNQGKPLSGSTKCILRID